MILQGTVGNKGQAKGMARVVHNESDLKKIVTGDILIIEHGNISIIKVINKISGIITDQGGITTHTALLAREHNLPCIIGTQTATRDIKDGQEIVLDAEKGIINF